MQIDSRSPEQILNSIRRDLRGFERVDYRQEPPLWKWTRP